MKRTVVLGLLVAAGVLSWTVAAMQQPPAGGAQQPAAQVIEVEKLKDSLFVLRGGGGNSAVFVMSNGVTVVDTKNPGWGQPLLDKIRELTDKPVTLVINTHTHGDHVSGNVEFPTSADIVTHENTAANMKRMAPVTGLAQPATPTPNIFTQNNGRGLPKRTFTDRMTLGSGVDRIELLYFGRAHTDGDAWVLFPTLRVLHAGDAFSGKNVPIIDANNGGSAVEFPETLSKVHAAIVKNVDSIITGHSTVMTPKDLSEYADFMRDFLNAVREAKKAGRTAEEVAKSWTIPAKYGGYAAPQATRVQANVQTAFKELP